MSVGRLPVAGIFAAIASVAVAAWLLGPEEMVFRPARSEEPAGPLHGDVRFSQTAVARMDGLAAVELELATYGRTADGTLNVELRAHGSGGGARTEGVGAREGSRLLASWSRDAGSVVDNARHRFWLPEPARGVAGARVEVVVSRDGLDEAGGGRPLTVYRSAGDDDPDGRLLRDRRMQPGDLAIGWVYRPGWPTMAVARLERTGLPAPVALAAVGGMVAAAWAALFAWPPAGTAGGESLEPADRARSGVGGGAVGGGGAGVGAGVGGGVGAEAGSGAPPVTDGEGSVAP